MFSIGALSKQTGVKVPTIRYYEQIGLIDPADRTQGNQRRYNDEALQRLGFIKHARELGFSIETITALIDLNNHPDRSCAEATRIAHEQLTDVREGGITALKKQINPDHCHQNRTDESIANTVVEFSLDNPHLGQVQVSNHLRKQYKIELSATGVRNVWLRENMQTIGLRLQKKASLSALL